MILTYRPLDHYPGLEHHFRYASPFGRATWDSTLDKLERELEALRAKNVVILMDVAESDLRLNGSIRVQARPSTPRVVLAFDSMHGSLKYGCDRFHDWQDNVRAIAHGLEALRKLERYGIASRGEQYTGWKALGSGIAMGPATMSAEQAAQFIAQQADIGADGGDIYVEPDRLDPAMLERLYRLAAKRLHPDTGGDPELFKRLVEAKLILDEAVF